MYHLTSVFIIVFFFLACEKRPFSDSKSDSPPSLSRPTTKDPSPKVPPPPGTEKDRDGNQNPPEPSCPVAAMTLQECLQTHIKTHKVPATDKIRPLSYCQFREFENRGALSKQEADALVVFAQKNKNPILFSPIPSTNLPDFKDYTLNFLWINSERATSPGFITNNPALLQVKIIDPVKDWQTKQPLALINIWYDGQTLVAPKKAVKATREKLAGEGVNTSKITFLDIRDIQIVKNHPQFLDQFQPVFFRVDFAKAITADHLMRQGQLFTVNIDSDIAGITREQMFDEKTMRQLTDFGYSFGKANTTTLAENSFIMLYNSNATQTLAMHRQIVIDDTMELENDKVSAMPPQKIPFDSVYKRYQEHVPNKEYDGTSGFRAVMSWRHFLRQANNDEALALKLKGAYVGIPENKDMIFPRSQQMSPGYAYDLIPVLKKALVGPEGCP